MNKLLIVAAAASFPLASHAAIYNSTGSPFDIVFDTGSYSWAGNSPTLTSSDTTSIGLTGSSSSSTGILTEITPPEIGVPGLIEIYSERTTTTFKYDQQVQSIGISFQDSITVELQTPETISLMGSISLQPGETQILNGDSVFFNMGFSPQIDPLLSPDLNGALEFFIGNGVNDWLYSYRKDFSSSSSVGFSESIGTIDFAQDVYFSAVYTLDSNDIGDPNVPFDLSNLYLNVSASDSIRSSNYDIEVGEPVRTVYALEEIPALQPIPLPGAFALFLSGSAGLLISRKLIK